MILLHVTIVSALGVETVHECMLWCVCISSQYSVTFCWYLEFSLESCNDTKETDKYYKQGVVSPGELVVKHSPAYPWAVSIQVLS